MTDPESMLAAEAKALQSAIAGYSRLQERQTQLLADLNKTVDRVELLLHGDGSKDRPGLEKELLLLEPRVRSLEEFRRLVIAHLLGAWTVLLGAGVAGVGWLVKKALE